MSHQEHLKVVEVATPRPNSELVGRDTDTEQRREVEQRINEIRDTAQIFVKQVQGDGALGSNVQRMLLDRMRRIEVDAELLVAGFLEGTIELQAVTGAHTESFFGLGQRIHRLADEYLSQSPVADVSGWFTPEREGEVLRLAIELKQGAPEIVSTQTGRELVSLITEAARARINHGDWRETGDLFETLPPSDQEAVWAVIQPSILKLQSVWIVDLAQRATTDVDYYLHAGAYVEEFQARLKGASVESPFWRRVIDLFEKQVLTSTRHQAQSERWQDVPRHLIARLDAFSSQERDVVLRSYRAMPPGERVQLEEMVFAADAPQILSFCIEIGRELTTSVVSELASIRALLKRFPQDARKSFYDGKGKGLSPEGRTMHELNALFVIGSFPESTAEQLALVYPTQIAWLTLLLDAQGERAVERYWDQSNVEDFVDQHPKGPSPEDVAFISNLPPSLRAHLPTEKPWKSGYEDSRRGRTVYPDAYLNRLACGIKEFGEFLADIPIELKESFLGELRPCPYLPPKDRLTGVSRVEIEHLKSFNSFFTQPVLRPESFIEKRAAFSEERWPVVLAGLERLRTTGYLFSDNSAYAITDLAHQVGKSPEAEREMLLAGELLKRGTTFVEDNDRWASDAPRRKKRDVQTLQSFYRGLELCRTFLTDDFESLATFLRLSTELRQVARAVIDGSLYALSSNTIDLPMIEGYVVRLEEKLSSFIPPKFANETERVADERKFIALSPELRARYLFLSKWLTYEPELFDLVSTTEGAVLEDFFESWPATASWTKEAALAMAACPGAKGLFFYLTQDEHAHASGELPVIQKLIALHNAGFPESFHLAKSSSEKLFVNRNYDDYEDRLLEIDPEELIKRARFATTLKFGHYTLIDLLNLPSFTDDEQMERYMWSADLQGAKFSMHIYEGDVLEVALMSTWQPRLEELPGLTGEKLPSYRTSLVMMPEERWAYLQAHPEILIQVMNGTGNASHALERVPAALLQNPLVWEYSFISTLTEAAVELQPHLVEALSVLSAAGVDTRVISAKDWLKLGHAHQFSPEFFSPEFLPKCRKNIQIILELADLIPEDREQMILLVDQFYFEREYDARSAVKAMEEGTNEWRAIPAEQAMLTRIFGASVPWDVAHQVRRFVVKGMSVERIEEICEGSVVPNHSEQYDLWELRCAWHRGKLAVSILHLQERIPGITGLDQEYGEQPELIGFYQRIEQGSELAQSRFRRLMSEHHHAHYLLRKDLLEGIETLLNHPNFALAFEMLQVRPWGFDKACANPAVLTHFCDLVTPEILERYRQLPKGLEIRAIDAPLFLQSEKSGTVLALYSEMQSLFGEQQEASVYDLLLLDAEHDLARIKKVRERSFAPLNSSLLQKFELVADEDMKSTIQKVRSLLTRGVKIDPEIVLKSLAEIPPGLREAVLGEKGLSSFGWPLLRYRDRLVGELKLSEHTVDEFIVDLYQAHDGFGHRLPVSIDYGTARVLLDHPKSTRHERQSVILEVISHYQGDTPSIVEYLLATDEGRLIEAIKANPDYLGKAAVKRELKIWQALIKQAPGLVFDALEHAPDKGVFSPEDFQEMVDAYLLEGGSQIALSSRSTNVSVEQKEAIERQQALVKERIDGLPTRWHENIPRSIALFEKLVWAGDFQLPTVEAIFAMQQAVAKSEDPAVKVLETRAASLLIESLIHFDPLAKSTFKNPEKLGRLRGIIINNMLEYIRHVSLETTDFTQVTELVRQKLTEIRRAFESSDAADSRRRTIFLDMYKLSTCNDPSVAEELKNDSSQMTALVTRDVQEVLLASGSDRERRFAERRIATTTDPEERRVLEEALHKGVEQLQQADRRNRTRTDHLPVGALTHGVGSENIALVLGGGAFSGELIGPRSAADWSGLLGLDTCEVRSAQETLRSRYDQLNNRGYGDVMLVFGAYGESEAQTQRPAYHSGVIGVDHKLVRCGIASSEITSIIVRAHANDGVLIQLKKEIAKFGGYIPIVTIDGVEQFSVAEFDQMKPFFHELSKQGYPVKIIEDVFTYYQDTNKGRKQTIVLEKAISAARGGRSTKQADLAILVSFLKGNDLNGHDDAWYEEAPLEQIMSLVHRGVQRKVNARGREMLFKTPPTKQASISASVEQVSSLERRPNIFLDNFFQKQLPFAGLESRTRAFEEAAVDVVFHRRWNNVARTREIAALFTEQKKVVMQTLWKQVWDELASEENEATSEQKSIWEEYKKRVTPVLTGSAGRREMVLGSDLDYLLLVDDETTPLPDEEGLKAFINTTLTERMNQILKKNGISGDAGLAKEDRLPYTKLSALRTFEVNLNAARQAEEPTNIVDAAPLFDEDADLAVVAKAKYNLLKENPTASRLDAYILRELELRSGHFPSYIERFEDLYESFASGDVLNKIKESMQRTITFKIYHLLFEARNAGKLTDEDLAHIPADTADKLELLRERGVLTAHQARVSQELLGFAYRLRFAGELYSRESGNAEASKVSNVRFRTEDISYQERAHLFQLLKDFKTEVLYK